MRSKFAEIAANVQAEPTFDTPAPEPIVPPVAHEPAPELAEEPPKATRREGKKGSVEDRLRARYAEHGVGDIQVNARFPSWMVELLEGHVDESKKAKRASKAKGAVAVTRQDVLQEALLEWFAKRGIE